MKIYPIIKKKVGGPTVAIPDSNSTRDAIANLIALDIGSVVSSDVVNVLNLHPEIASHSTSILTTTTSQTISEVVIGSEGTTMSLSEIAVSRTVGTSDSDRWGDSWTDGTVGNTGINHGNENPLQVQGLSTSNRIAWLEADFTKYAGLTPSGNAHTLKIRVSNNSLSAQNFTCNMGFQVSRPFTESTLTSSNKPATPSGFVQSQSAPARNGDSSGNADTLTFTFSNAVLSAMFGKWVLIAITGGGAQTGTLYVSSREAPTDAARPIFNFTATI